MGVLEQILTERLQQIEDEVERLRQDARVEQAQGERAQTVRTLERIRALLQLQATTREQQRELAQLGDPAFIAEANAQFLLGLQRQIAELRSTNSGGRIAGGPPATPAASRAAARISGD